jgi:zinc/manganese transport system substrate-binding protein
MMRIILIPFAAATALTGCGGPASHGRVDVLAAENVYGDIAEQIGAADVRVTSILTDPSADPHLYTPRPSTILTVSRARIVMRNGLGYDAFIDKLLHAAPSRGRRVIVAGTDQANPHVWYDPAVVRRVALGLRDALEAVDPAHRGSYAERTRRFIAQGVVPVAAAERALRAEDGGAPVAYTEPVPGYMLERAGLRNLAPASFTRAIQDGSEASPGAVASMLALVRERRVRVLLYNAQAVSAITIRIRSAARAAGVPVLPVTETLPRGETWQAWQLRELRALREALAR